MSFLEPNSSAASARPLPKPAIVIPVHNRRETTLRCLAALDAIGASAWAGIIVVDDGSTDGTGAAVRARHPGVTLLEGDGTLWWTGAIVQGMKHALGEGAELIFWLNDDCLPEPGTLERLAHHAVESRGVAVGQAFTPSGFRYGGFMRTGRGLRGIHVPPGQVRACDAFGGNCVCFPRALVERVGLPDSQRFPHNYGDCDYGLRVRRCGLPVEVLGDALCRNDDNRHVVSKSWLLSTEPMRSILASFFQIRSPLYPPALFRYRWRHWGLSGVILAAASYLKFCVYCVVRLLLPRRWLLAAVGQRSAAWKRESFEER